MRKPKGPAKGVRVTNPLVPAPAKHHHRHRHQKPGKPHHHHHPGPGGVRASSPLPGPGKPVHLGKPHHHHKPPKKPVKRKLALGEDVACCAAEALAASLRPAGVPVGDEDVLALYWRTASDPDAGATILATLEAASAFGLAGQKPSWAPVAHPLAAGILVGADPGAVLDQREVFAGAADGALGREIWNDRDLHLGPVHPASVILGVTLPGGPHALCLDPSGAVWSWGGLYDLDPAVAIEEAWTVEWST